jgi:hypothetical protein
VINLAFEPNHITVLDIIEDWLILPVTRNIFIAAPFYSVTLIII